MRKIAVTVMVAALMALGIGAAQAQAGDAGSPGNKGLCNAYSHNDQHAKDHGQSFVRLAQTAGDYNGDGTTNAQDVTSYCADNVPAVGNGG